LKKIENVIVRSLSAVAARFLQLNEDELGRDFSHEPHFQQDYQLHSAASTLDQSKKQTELEQDTRRRELCEMLLNCKFVLDMTERLET